MMKRIITGSALVLAALMLAAPAGAQDLKAKLAEAKQAAAKNQQALRSYSWISKTQLSYKGEVKSTKVEACQYGPDGQVQKTPIVEPPPPEQKRGLRGRVADKKRGEMKEELESAANLVKQYVPPDPGLMQVVVNTGAASLSQAGPGFVALKFPGYVKQGDSLTLTFESTVKSLQQVDVATWLDDPSKPVTFRATMQQLPDGTNYPGQVVLAIPSSNIEVTITNSNYQKISGS
jgi:hypothetical protein